MKLPHRLQLHCFALVLLAYGSALAASPILIGTSSSGDALYADMVSSEAGVMIVRARTVYGTPKTMENLTQILSMVAVEEINCLHATRRTKRIEFFQNSDASGSPAWARDLAIAEKPPALIQINEQSASALMYKMACGLTSTPQVAANIPQNPKTTPPPVLQRPSSLPASTSPPPTGGENGSPSVVNKELPTNTIPTPREPLPPPPLPAQAAQPTPPTADSENRLHGPIADLKPFSDSGFSLRTLGLLAEYVYFDDVELAFNEALLKKIQTGHDRVASDGRLPPLIDQAYHNVSNNTLNYRYKYNAKNEFLASAALKPLALPKLSISVPESFRAELYEHIPSNEKLLVFRGSKFGTDWVTNLWSGVDLLEIEAPHYRAASELVKTLKKRGESPMVVGHSLGGGMAQYVGKKFGLKVVGFNSAPLPLRYFNDGAVPDTKYIRLFSAVETSNQRDQTGQQEGHADPVSIVLPHNATGSIKEFFNNYEPIKAHQQLVKPICLKSVPFPYVTDVERKSFSNILNSALSTGLVNAAFGKIIPGMKVLAADAAVIQKIRADVEAGLSDPVWQPSSNSKLDQRVANRIKTEVANVAVEQYKALGGVAAVGKAGYKFALGNSWGDMLAGAGSLALTLGKMAAAEHLVTHYLYPHSMERFNRGMQSTSDANVFITEPVRAQCSEVQSIL